MQFVGGIAAAGIISALLPGSLQAESSLGSGTTIAQGFFLEAFLTAQLVMTIIMLAVEKSRTSFIAPLAIGMTLFVDHMVGKSEQLCPYIYTYCFQKSFANYESKASTSLVHRSIPLVP